MAKFAPTPSQAEAMTVQGTAVLVSAGAGSGKTRVLVERLINRVKDPERPVDIDRFLIITFTRAAAGELRGRIMQELSEEIAKDPGNRYLRRQSALCSRAGIGTIHSFCSGILRENCQTVSLTPDFKIIEDDRADVMKAAAMARVLERAYKEPEKHPGFTNLVDAISTGRDDEDLEKLTLSLYEKMQSHARPMKWAREQVQLMETMPDDIAESRWGKAICRQADARAAYWKKELEGIIRDLSAYPECQKFCDELENTVHALESYREALKVSWDKAREGVPAGLPRIPGKKQLPDPELLEQIKARKGACSDGIKKLTGLLYAPEAELKEMMHRAAPAMKTLVELTDEFDREYTAEKRRAGVVDYADLEHFAAQILTDEQGNATELAKSISQRYCEIMVDEYQDVSPVQDVIFQAISREKKNLFFVGDVKQSIYGFRLADPGIFTKKEEKYKANPKTGHVVYLRENFRSRREIIECVNAVFGACMSRELGEKEYDETQQLNFGADYYGGAVPVPEIQILYKTEPDKNILTENSGKTDTPSDDEEDGLPAENDELEAVWTAKKIRELTTPVGEQKAFTYGDIAILLRSANENGAVYADVLHRYGIPVAGGRGAGYFVSSEVNAVIAVLTVTDNPHQDIALTTALASPLFGFSPDELACLRSCDKDNDLYMALLAMLEQKEKTDPKWKETVKKAEFFLQKLNLFREAAPDMELNGLLQLIYTELDVQAIYSATADGERRFDNLAMLPQLADRFTDTGHSDLHHFVLWLERMVEKRTAVTAGADETSAVRIMTIHKSKGLEFPVVFLGNAGKKFNMQDQSGKVLVHKDLGLGPILVDRADHLKYNTVARKAIAEQVREDTLSEEMRLLYVAMTRPKERLFITGVMKAKKAEELLEKAQNSARAERIDPEQLKGCTSYLQWLMYAAEADHEKHIRVCLNDAPPSETDKNTEMMETAESDTSDGKEQETAQKTEEDRVRRNLEYIYPYRSAEELPSKITATELKGREENDPEAESLELLAAGQERKKRPQKTISAFRMPDFAGDREKLTGAALGTAMHTILQYIDFQKTNTVEEVRAEITRLAGQKFISEKEKQSVVPEQIWKLFQSETGKRMKTAEHCRREFRFSLLCRADELLHTGDSDEILLQGVMDCVIEEQGTLTIIDYKTDYAVDAEALKELTEYYTGQLATYAMAAERIFALPVKQCILYFLRTGDAVTVCQTSGK